MRENHERLFAGKGVFYKPTVLPNKIQQRPYEYHLIYDGSF